MPLREPVHCYGTPWTYLDIISFMFITIITFNAIKAILDVAHSDVRKGGHGE